MIVLKSTVIPKIAGKQKSRYFSSDIKVITIRTMTEENNNQIVYDASRY